ncbi:DUF7139 domain-containing protein [Halopiger aswanensis]|uniref:Cell division protein A N-terminal domain-containing protein n=1 Tax=Halopiger aswanensis TaxID=148449 RepID=A0A3R7HJL2_9EURY|nr:permease [Halopiger aswanensis]RKD97093.1 hypothetical protein ATJ93_0074 [Halopiger aswanensis]
MPAEQPLDGYLFDLYRRYIGEPENRTDVYLGFGLFLGGVGLAVVALLLFLWSSTFSRTDPAYFTWVQPAYALGMLSLPAMILGVVVLLPADRKTIGVSAAGAAVTVGATLGFLVAYPDNWNFMAETDYTVEVTATYAVGLAGLTASTGAALIAHYLDMAREADRVAVDSSEDEGESYSDEEIQQDIDEAMEDVELSWGGVEKTEHKRLSFSENEFDEVNVSEAGTTTTRSSGVDAQVAGLKGLKGGETKTTTSSATVDDQTQKLKELREQRRAEELAEADDGGRGFLTSLRNSLRNLLKRN